MEKKINSWSDYDRMVKKELKGSIARFEDTYIYQLQEENEKLRQWDCNKDSRNSRQRVANKKLIKDNERLKEENEQLKRTLTILAADVRAYESFKKDFLEQEKMLKASVKYYVDILTDLKKWLEELSLFVDNDLEQFNTYTVLNKIKELEDENNAK